jgi:hypothetical protein
MKFIIAVEIEVKNDAITRECGEHDMAMMLLSNLESNKLSTLPWVIDQYYGFITTKE